MLRCAAWLAVTTGFLALVLAPPAVAGTAPKPKQVKLACELKSNGGLKFVTSARQCRSRVGKLLRINPGPVSVCVHKRGRIKRIKNQVAACSRTRKSNETPLQLPSARDEFFCVEKKSKAMRHSKRRPRCRARGKFKEFLAFVPKGAVAPPRAANSAPRAEADNATASEESPSVVPVLANDVDVDGDQLAVGTVDTGGTVGSVSIGPGGGVTYNASGSFNDLGPGETATDSFTYTARDPAGALSAPARVQVTVSGVNDAPQLGAGGGGPSTFTEGQAGQVSVDAGMSVGDVDSDTLNRATVTIAGGRTGGDALHFTNTAAITGTYDSGTGVLTLTGTDSVAGYQDALRSVAFSTSSQDPGTGRTVEFRADDGPDESAPLARQVVVAPVNDGPAADDEKVDGANRAVGNTALVVNDPNDGAPDPAGPQKTVSGDLLDGDSDVDGPALGVRPETVGTQDGGQAVLEADGDFTYLPPAGCTGGTSDAFDYTLEDNHPSAELTDVGTVTIALADCVWYVDDSASATGANGRSDKPFPNLNTLRGAGDVDGSGHHLFVYDGTQTGGLPLEANQKLFSEKHGLTLADGGTGTVTLEPADGAGTELQGGLQLATGNSVQGIDLGTTGSASVFALSGSSVGSAGVNNLTSADIDNPAGGAVSIGGTANTIDMRFGELSSSGSSTSAVTVANATGSFSATSGTLGNSTGTTVAINGGSGNFTLGGDVADGTGQVLSIQNRTGNFTHDFNGGVSGGSVLLQTNAGTTRFDGGLVLSTGASNAFAASNAGTLAITDANGSGLIPDNTIATTTGRALDVSGTTIHSDDLTFRRISSDGASTGISLSGTGNAGGLTVAGSGGTCDGPFTCTGGAIQNSTGAGIALTNVGGGVDLTRVLVHSGDDDGIRGATVNGFALRNSLVTDNGNLNDEMGLEFSELTGTVALNAATVTGNRDNNVSVANTSGTLNMTVTDGQIGENELTTDGEDGILVDANNSAVQNVTIAGTDFTNNRGDHVQFATGSTGAPTQNVSIVNTDMLSPVNSPDIAGGGITISPGGSAIVNATISGNDIQGSRSNAIRVDSAGDSTPSTPVDLDATITGNTIGSPAVADSGSFSASGMSLRADGTAAVDALVSGNFIHQYANTHGILITQGAGATATMNATVVGNTLSNPSNNQGGAGGVKAEAGSLPGDAGRMCLNLGGAGALRNDLTAAGSEIASSPGVFINNTRDVFVTQAQGAQIELPGLGVSASSTAAVQTYLQGRNSLTTVAAATDPATKQFIHRTDPCPQPTP